MQSPHLGFRVRAFYLKNKRIFVLFSIDFQKNIRYNTDKRTDVLNKEGQS